ncbi:LacI family DNA-binding transcriptional regulator [Devosia sp. 2618]|uniref:LacI family DNA-binding transcriptional regulator n=1 Tax=Devosia sp. 2618 TaxID=3156454 RepID=UPI00339B0B0E
MEPVRKAPTIQDVARAAAVSTATVSRALSAPDRVSESTRARISAAVLATGYTPNQSARSLRQRTSRTILVALPDLRNPFFAAVLDAIEREATGRGYGMLVANRFPGIEPARRMRDYFSSNRIDGLLLLDGTVDLQQLIALAGDPQPVPLIVVCEEIPAAPFHTVKTDNAKAAARATRYLIELGHRRIGHIRGPDDNILTGERQRGFEAAMSAAGLEIRKEWLFQGAFDMETGHAVAHEFAALKERPTALFVANDASAIGFLAGLREHGLDCPRDVSIIGFDDQAIATHSWPPLTTMRQPRAELGRIATAALIDVIEGKQDALPRSPVVLQSELIIRASTAPLPR